MENYSVGEIVYLPYQVENLEGDQYTVTDATYNITVDDVKVVEGASATVTSTGKIIVLFQPTKVGTNVLDIWYHVTSIKANMGLTDPLTEYRTVRFVLRVVR